LDAAGLAGTADQLAASDLQRQPARHVVVATSAATTSRNFAVSANCRKRAILPSRTSQTCTTGRSSCLPVAFPRWVAPMRPSARQSPRGIAWHRQHGDPASASRPPASPAAVNLESQPELGRPSAKLPCLHSVAAHTGDVALVEGEPAMIRPGLQRLQHAPRPPQPTARHSHSAVEVEVIGREPGGHARSACRISAFAIKAVGALAGLEHRVRVIKPPRRPAEPLQGLGRLASLQLLLEDRPSFLRRPPGERRPPLLTDWLTGAISGIGRQ
jgi:hypothetical protein